jgi:hypothetical protein
MSQQGVSHVKATGCLPAVVRLFWLIAGNAALLFLALSIAQRRALSVLDFVYWATVAAMILARYYDIAHLDGETKDGEPATLRHWRRYIIVLIAISGALWGLAHRVLPRLVLP